MRCVCACVARKGGAGARGEKKAGFIVAFDEGRSPAAMRPRRSPSPTPPHRRLFSHARPARLGLTVAFCAALGLAAAVNRSFTATTAHAAALGVALEQRVSECGARGQRVCVQEFT